MMKSITNFYQNFQKNSHQFGLSGGVVFTCYGYLKQMGFNVSDKYFSIHPGDVKYSFRARFDSSDIAVFNQIFLEKEYGCLKDIEHPKLIIDCGANVGYSSIWFLNQYPQAHLVAIEPDAENFKLCRQNLLPYGKRISLYQTAVWPDEKDLVIVKWQQGMPGMEWATQVRECRAEEKPDSRGMNIASILRKSSFEAIDILKLDVEKAESMIFSKNYSEWLPKVKNIVIELHDKECEDIFFQALSPYHYDLSRSGELTVCKNMVLQDKNCRDRKLADAS